jgi:hypothetical protein
MKKIISAVKYIFQDKGARAWSNTELKKFAALFSGDIINVSGWTDSDKGGGRYADYFVNKKSYIISNYKGEKGFSSLPNEIFLDLEQPLPKDLQDKFDVVFNHTTIEHVFDIFAAFKNLCLMSRDVVIITLPFVEQVHELPGNFGDYWRPTHLAIEKLFEQNGFKVLYGSSRPIPPIYHFFIATRQPGDWKDKFPVYDRRYITQGNSVQIFLLHLVKYATLPIRKPIFLIKYLLGKN